MVLIPSRFDSSIWVFGAEMWIFESKLTFRWGRGGVFAALFAKIS